ncbi:dephospho-CoA kinase [Syntrophotalea acetylenivorans]|uniref:Dephospho-CoA kinase n=1 Tax=Syntrophotalea acetylenivorans TaxID=1842532 RepID=A0A1L3GNZ8_9BACT|nr:dephospho-CoA kinase [Syntrophotalea acetylenivorans]APG27642.1 dephospho-CoA kinase [Syntrophotalea acetylenivorans]
MVLGITGGIASGKTTVAQTFQALGAVVVSADLLAREVVRPGAKALRQIAAYFGRQVLREDGTLNRQLLGDMVFNDHQARLALNNITHPAIAELASKRLREAEQEGAPLVVYDAPLLFEAGADRQVDKVLVVKVDAEVQLARLMARDGIDRQKALARIDSQMPQMEKLARADFIVDNSGSPQETEEQVRSLMEYLSPPSREPKDSGSAE